MKTKTQAGRIAQTNKTAQTGKTAQVSKTTKIHNYLKGGSTLTTLEAVKKFGVLRLPNIIGELNRLRNAKIKSVEVRKGSVRYCVYYIGKKPNL